MNTVILRRLLLTALLLALAALAVSGIADRQGEHYLQQGLKRALVTFAVSRALNGVISVAQETEISLEPAGVGVTLLPGQILDPVNDLIERFSWIMLAATTSLGLQQLFATIFGWRVFSWMLLGWTLFAVFLVWQPALTGAPWRWRRVVLRMTVVFFVLRFLTPVIAVSGEAVYRLFLQDRYEASMQTLQTARQEVAEVEKNAPAPQSAASSPSLLEQAKRLYESARDGLDVRERMARLSAVATQATESTIELIVIFVFQTILFPLLFLWLLAKLVRALLGT